MAQIARNLAMIGFLKFYGIIVEDFDAIFKEGESVANRKFVIYRLENQQQHFRVGLSVSKKLGNAVTRNQIKRRIRHVLIENSNQIVDNVDFVVIARKGVETLEYAEIEKNLLHVLKLAKIYQEGNRSEEEITID